jgi:probable HAF family extracellular repeat protein
MKSRFMICIAVVTVLAALASSVPLAAQQKKGHMHHHYKLIDLGTFGGPQAFTQDAPQFLTNGGTVVGWADTSTLDPNYPNSCFFCGPYIFHAFQWNKGVLNDLGALPGVNSSAAFWVADNGLIAGFSENGATDPLLGIPEVHAVVWKSNQLTDLGTLGGGYESTAFAVNTKGQVTGFSNNLVPDPFNPLGTTQQRTFLWQNGVMQDLGTLGGTDAGLLGFTGDVEINERGQVTACSYTNTTPNPTTGLPTLDPFLWDQRNGMADLGSLGGTLGCAVNLNSRGQVIGYSNLPGDMGCPNACQFHPFLWTKPGPMQDLDTYGGTAGVAISINDAGEVVGIDADQTGEFFATLWKDGAATNLGTLDTLPNSNAQWINSKEQIVGFAATSDFSFHVAFLWENGGPMVDLNTLVAPSQLQLSQALHINDRGEIAGTGTLPNGDAHNFLLIPCDENHPGIDGCDYSMVEVPVAAAQTTPAVNASSRTLPQSLMGRVNRYRLPGPAFGPRN